VSVCLFLLYSYHRYLTTSLLMTLIFHPQLDPMGWASLAAGLLVASISFFTSYSHVDLFGILQFKVN
jgi:hypothetical protein